LIGWSPINHQSLTALEQWKASRHWLLWVAVVNRNVIKRDAPVEKHSDLAKEDTLRRGTSYRFIQTIFLFYDV